jgi:hypothetical protein
MIDKQQGWEAHLGREVLLLELLDSNKVLMSVLILESPLLNDSESPFCTLPCKSTTISGKLYTFHER